MKITNDCIEHNAYEQIKESIKLYNYDISKKDSLQILAEISSIIDFAEQLKLVNEV